MKEVLPLLILKILQLLYQAGGRPVLVGGCVRDYYRRQPLKDIDIEVFHLSFDQLHHLLSSVGKFHFVGNSFGVFKMKQMALDISLPRQDNKTHQGHKGFSVTFDPDLPFVEAARRRDLTINSIGFDIFAAPDQQWLDPFKGREDIDHQKLSATDPVHFIEDPLRALRVMQFSSRFKMTPDSLLIELCQSLDLAELPSERILSELNKWIIAPFPEQGWRFLQQSHLINYFPGFTVLPDCLWSALKKLNAKNQNVLISWVLLYYYIPEIFKSAFLDHLNFPQRQRKIMIESLACLIQLKQAQQKVDYLQIIRSLKTVDLMTLVILVQHLNEPTYAVIVEKIHHYGWLKEIPSPIVTAQHLRDKGKQSGKDFGVFLARCLHYQDLTDEKDPEIIIAATEKYFHEKT